jgi:ribosome-associated heat shock protein Hsp15
LTSTEEQRLDKWLWYARLVKSRTLAAKLVEAGCIRVNRQRVVKAAATVKCGDVLTATLHGRVQVIEILALGERRVPAGEAQTLYAERLSPSASEPATESRGE